MYYAAIKNHGDSRFHATTSNAEFVMAVNGGGANPVETFLAGLCGCIGHYVLDFLRENELSCPAFSVKAQAGQSTDKSRLSDIALRIELKQTRLSQRDEAALLRFVERCKLHNTLKSACEITLALA